MLESVNTSVQKETAADMDNTLMHRFDDVKSRLRAEIGDTAFRTWVQPVEAVSYRGGTLEVAAPTRFIRDWVRTHYADRIRTIYAQQYNGCTRVECTVDASAAPAPAARSPHATAYEPVVTANENADMPVEDISSTLDARFTFDNFIVGPTNELAYAAALRLAKGDDVNFNPLFLQGGVGLGKTHLMQAIAHMVRDTQPQKRVIYMSAEKFMYQFVRALRARETMAFKEQFRAVDILMIDDIQFICGKESTQEEFFHTFNALIDQGKHVVLSADKAPGDLDGLDERLRSRMGMGLVAGIQMGDHDLRLKMLHAKCALMKRGLPSDVLDFLARKITSNMRELEGALNRLIAHAELINRPVTLESAEELLQDLLRASERRVTIEDIQRRVADHYNLRIADILSPRRARPVARPRQIAMYLAKALTQHSLPEIGRKFGGRDHTTIIHGVRKVEELMERDANLAADVDSLRRLIAG